MSIQIQFRRGTAAQWTAANTVLAAGEMAIETDTNQFKIGDGVTAWTSLAYGGLQGEPGLTEGEPIMIRDTMTAGGTIAAGDAVWVDSNGKIQKGIGGITIGSPAESAIVASDTKSLCVWLSDTVFVIATIPTAAATVYARCGSVSGTTITMGDRVTVASVASIALWGLIRLSDTSFVIYCSDTTAGYPNVRCGSVSGTTITLGTILQIQAAAVLGVPLVGCIQRLDDTHFVTVFQQAATNQRMNVYSVSGTTITKGTDSDITVVSNKCPTSICVLDSTHYCIAYAVDATNVAIICCSVSDTTITKGTAAAISTSDFLNAYSCYLVTLSSTSFAMAYLLGGATTTLKFRRGTVSGTTITLESVINQSTAITAPTSAVLLKTKMITSTLFSVWAKAEKLLTTVDVSSNPPVIVEEKTLSSVVEAFPATSNFWVGTTTLATSPYTMTYYTYSVSGTGASLMSTNIIFTGTGNPVLVAASESMAPNTNNTKIIHTYGAGSGPTNYTAPAICSELSSSGGTTAAGIAIEAASTDESCDVALQAAAIDLWSGLTIGATYYVTAAGGLSTAPQTINGVSSRLGTAVTTSKILINTAKTDPKQLY